VKTVAIIQARMSSTRLPGKSLMDICGKPMLQHVVERVRRSGCLDQVVVATSTDPSDDRISLFCAEHEIAFCRGDLDDVLNRFHAAARWCAADVLVRITADCPLIDPQVLRGVVDVFQGGEYDYVSNVSPPTFPDGLDVEVFSMNALEIAWREANHSADRLHVTPFLRENPAPGRFRQGNVKNSTDLSTLRWTVDEPRDLVFVRAVFGSFDHNRFSMTDVLDLMDQRPELSDVNADIIRNEGYLKDLLLEGRHIS